MFDYDPPKEKEPVDYTGLKIGGILAHVFFLITFLSNADIGLVAYIVLGMVMLAIKIRWQLRKRVWFWATQSFFDHFSAHEFFNSHSLFHSSSEPTESIREERARVD